MKGTAKQIKWAQDIVVKIVRVFDICVLDGACEESRRLLDSWKSALQDDDVYAGDIIDLFGDIRFSFNQEKDFMEILSVYRIAYPNTEGQKRILGRRDKNARPCITL